MTSRTKPRRRARKPVASPPIPIPPIVVAFARLIDPDYHGLHPDFERAWHAMPAIVDAYVKGKGDSIDHLTASGLIGEIIDADVERSRKATEPYEKTLGQAKDVLDAAHTDLWGCVYITVHEPAFNCGLALGLYLALNNGGTR